MLLPDTSSALFTSDDFIACFSPTPVALVSKLFVLLKVAYSVESFAALTTNCKDKCDYCKTKKVFREVDEY